jgi:hypothetical protein
MAEAREKTIRLTGLIPENYRLWASQSEATFRVYGVLDIVLGREANPSPERAASSTPSESTPDHNAEPPLSAAQRKLIEKWQLRHDLSRQALLSCLQPAELTKVYHLQSAHDIWKCLADEYGGVSDLKRAQANASFYSLQKQPTLSMQDHINAFTKLQQEVNYHRESPLSDVDVNLAFLQSLGEDWRTFQQSLGSRLHTLAPPMLFAEVLAFDSANNPVNSRTPQLPAPSPLKHALHTKHYSNRKSPPKSYDRPSTQGRKYCRYCKRNTHLIDECLKKRWRDTQARDEDEDDQEEIKKHQQSFWSMAV